MRLLFGVMLVLLLIVLVGFALTNPQTVSVTLWATTYSDVPLGIVVLVALATGVAFTTIIALVEGTAIRLGNRRLRREIHRLETELHFVRTNPSDESAKPAPETPTPESAAIVAGAPVYDAEPAEIDGEVDDEPYAGGRAV